MSDQKRGLARIGTSGVVIPGPKNSFPEKFRSASRLHYYNHLFNTVEVNSTFKKLPRTGTFEKWCDEVRPEFQFTIKMSSEITHAKQLAFDSLLIDRFMTAADHTGKRKGSLLVQFPASITFTFLAQVGQILKRVKQIDQNNQWHLAVEFRDPGWYRTETNELLAPLQGAIVLHDMPKSKYLIPQPGDPFAYFRFHGPTGDYRGGYSKEFLREQSEKINSLLASGKDVYVYFNNTMGNAFENAMSLKSMVEK